MVGELMEGRVAMISVDGGPGRDGKEIVVREAREVFKDFRFCHPTSHVFEDVTNGNSSAGDTRLTTAHFGDNRNSIKQFHAHRVIADDQTGNGATPESFAFSEPF
jgi:hypothetical protein